MKNTLLAFTLMITTQLSFANDDAIGGTIKLKYGPLWGQKTNLVYGVCTQLVDDKCSTLDINSKEILDYNGNELDAPETKTIGTINLDTLDESNSRFYQESKNSAGSILDEHGDVYLIRNKVGIKYVASGPKKIVNKVEAGTAIALDGVLNVVASGAKFVTMPFANKKYKERLAELSILIKYLADTKQLGSEIDLRLFEKEENLDFTNTHTVYSLEKYLENIEDIYAQSLDENTDDSSRESIKDDILFNSGSETEEVEVNRVILE